MEKINIILEALESVNLSDIVIYDMKETSPFYDYFVISSATSDRQLQASVNHIVNDLAKAKHPHPKVEGKQSKSWILVDTGDIIVNVFTKEERTYYNLEKMLAQIEKVSIDDFR